MISDDQKKYVRNSNLFRHYCVNSNFLLEHKTKTKQISEENKSQKKNEVYS